MIVTEASVLSSDFIRPDEKAREVEKAGVGGIKGDLMDCMFVRKITLG